MRVGELRGQVKGFAFCPKPGKGFEQEGNNSKRRLPLLWEEQTSGKQGEKGKTGCCSWGDPEGVGCCWLRLGWAGGGERRLDNRPKTLREWNLDFQQVSGATVGGQLGGHC